MLFNPLKTVNPQKGIFANSEDPDQCGISSGFALFAKIKSIGRLTLNPLIYTMDLPDLVTLNNLMEKSIDLQRIKM